MLTIEDYNWINEVRGRLVNDRCLLTSALNNFLRDMKEDENFNENNPSLRSVKIAVKRLNRRIEELEEFLKPGAGVTRDDLVEWLEQKRVKRLADGRGGNVTRTVGETLCWFCAHYGDQGCTHRDARCKAMSNEHFVLASRDEHYLEQETVRHAKRKEVWNKIEDIDKLIESAKILDLKFRHDADHISVVPKLEKEKASLQEEYESYQ